MRPPKDLLLKWIANITVMERTYATYVSTIQEIADIIKAEAKREIHLGKGYRYGKKEF